MDTNKILFVLAPKVDIFLPPLSVPCLMSYLKNKGWDASVHDLNIECYSARSQKYEKHWDFELQEFWNDTVALKQYFFTDARDEVDKMFERIATERPAYIGFSTWFTNFWGSVILAREINARWPRIRLIFGGPDVWLKLHMGNLDDKALAFIDAFVIGEGEASLHDLLSHFRDGKDISDSPGIAFFKNNTLQVLEPGDTAVPCKDLPLPDFTGIDLSKYTPGGTQIPLYFSRGCINRCIFCDERKIWRNYRTKTGLQLFNEVSQLKSMYPKMESIYFSESLINGNINELRSFCQNMIESGISVKWEGNAVIRKEMDRELLDLMARAGCKLLIYGLESASKRVLKFVGKVMSDGADIEQVVCDTAEAGIHVTVNIMFGLPGETEEDALENIDFVIRNKKYLHSIYPSWSFCYLAKLSDAYADPARWGLKPVTDVSFWESIDGTNTYPIRLERFERFCARMLKEGITIQYSGDKLADREKKLGYYYGFKGDYLKAAMYLSQAVEKEPWDTALIDTLNTFRRKVNSDICLDTPIRHTDENWLNGVARSWATAFLVNASEQARSEFRIGSRITFANTENREIVGIREEGSSIVVFLDGPLLDGNSAGFPNKFMVHHSCLADGSLISAGYLKAYIRMMAGKYKVIGAVYRFLKKLRDISRSIK